MPSRVTPFHTGHPSSCQRLFQSQSTKAAQSQHYWCPCLWAQDSFQSHRTKFHRIHTCGVLKQLMRKWEYRFPPQHPGAWSDLAELRSANFCLCAYCFSFIFPSLFLKVTLPSHPYGNWSHDIPSIGFFPHPLPSLALVLPRLSEHAFELNPLSQLLVLENPLTKTKSTVPSPMLIQATECWLWVFCRYVT